jgi:hypothetical protein
MILILTKDEEFHLSSTIRTQADIIIVDDGAEYFVAKNRKGLFAFNIPSHLLTAFLQYPEGELTTVWKKTR